MLDTAAVQQLVEQQIKQEVSNQVSQSLNDAWLKNVENKAIELKKYVDDRPLHELKDRMAYKETKTGGVIPICIANKEAQRKDLTQALKDYAEILKTVEQMREREAAKVEIRGNGDISTMAEDFLKRRNK